MIPIILRDSEATKRLFEAILDSPNGKRSLSRLARTCKALCEPALDTLWRELDNLIPIIGLFPGYLLRKARKPGLGLIKAPREEDWAAILRYSERVRRLSYDETASNFSASIFPILVEHRPRTYILPRLQELTWKVETTEGLDRCTLFLNPGLQIVNLELGAKLPQLSPFLADMSSRTKLTGFSFISPTSLPDSFTELLLRQNELERITLVAPGALSPGVGRWVASLPNLKHLQLDLTGRSMIAVEGFFDELRPRSGDSTPSSVASTDSGVFSGEELDFSEIRKSALRLTGDLKSKGSFVQLRRLQLSGDVSNITVFVRHLECPLTHLDLVIEDPPDNADWQDLSTMICDKFSDSLQSIRVSATGSSRFNDLLRSTSRVEPANGRLSLEHFNSLPNLTRMDIDLPESVVFIASDIKNIALACPKLEILRLCPLARFPQHAGPPKLTLEDLAPLMRACRYLHTLSITFNALPGSSETLETRIMHPSCLLRFNVGHSWISDPLQVAILLSHLSPRLENLKWFQEKNRPGYIEANATNWQAVSQIFPHLQRVRALEKSFSETGIPLRPETFDKAVDATVKTVDRGILAQVMTANTAIQWSPSLVDCSIDAVPRTVSAFVDATPESRQIGIDATPPVVSVAIEAVVSTWSKSVGTESHSPILPKSSSLLASKYRYPNLYILPSVLVGFVSFIYKLFVCYPITIPSRIMHMALATLPNGSWRGIQHKAEIEETRDMGTSTSEDTTTIALDTLQVRQ
ncbi:hypothetical protein BDQ17DRAFT_1230154 [Cyathus striatus]|nr:hypothetical protein BDQ17DRAFT_1230154 [Cyathus striatus]